MAIGKTRARRELERPSPNASDEILRALLDALHHAELQAFTNPTDEAAGSVDAILRTLLIALRRSDGEAVHGLGSAARKQAQRMQRDAGNAEAEPLGAWITLHVPPLLPVGARTDGEAVPLAVRRAIMFHGRGAARKGSRERVAFVQEFVRQVEAWLMSSCNAVDLAGRFVDVAYETRGWPILEGKAPTDRTQAIAPVAKAFDGVLRACKSAGRPPDPERVLVAGYRALGLNEATAEALLRALGQRETRTQRRDPTRA